MLHGVLCYVEHATHVGECLFDSDEIEASLWHVRLHDAFVERSLEVVSQAVELLAKQVDVLAGLQVADVAIAQPVDFALHWNAIKAASEADFWFAIFQQLSSHVVAVYATGKLYGHLCFVGCDVISARW